MSMMMSNFFSDLTPDDHQNDDYRYVINGGDDDDDYLLHHPLHPQTYHLKDQHRSHHSHHQNWDQFLVEMPEKGFLLSFFEIFHRAL